MAGYDQRDSTSSNVKIPNFSKELKSEKVTSTREFSPLATRKASEKTLIKLTNI